MSENKVKVNPTFHEQLEDNGKWKKEYQPEYKEYRKKWKEFPKKYILERAPIHLDIETSSICNLRCPMCTCTIELEKGKESNIKYGLMKMEMYKRIIDEAADIGVSSIKLNWRGEPTMNPHLVEMVKYAKEKEILDIMINTNAVRLEKKMSQELIEAGLDKIFFSVDSIDTEKYAKIRVGAEFDKVLKNIKDFVEINEKMGHPVFTRVQKVLMNETNEENEKFKDFFANIVDQVAFEDYIPYGEMEYGKKVKRGERIKFACSQLWQRMLITWDGECRVCCISANKPMIAGNIENQTIEEVWQGKMVSKLRELHKNGEWYQCELCKECYLPYM